MYFYYGIKNSSLELQADKPLELKIPEDRVNNLAPPDEHMQQGQQYMTTGMEDPYAPATDGYAHEPDMYAQQPNVYAQPANSTFLPQQPDPLAEDPWSKYN